MDIDLAIGPARLVVPLFIIRWPLAIIAYLIPDAIDQTAGLHEAGRGVATSEGSLASEGSVPGLSPIGRIAAPSFAEAERKRPERTDA